MIESIVAWVEFIAENAEILIFSAISAINSTNFILLLIFYYIYVVPLTLVFSIILPFYVVVFILFIIKQINE